MDQYAKAVIEAADRWLAAVDDAVMDAGEAARTNSETVVALAAAVKEWRQNRSHFSIFSPHHGTEARQRVLDLPTAAAFSSAPYSGRPAALAAAAGPAQVPAGRASPATAGSGRVRSSRAAGGRGWRGRLR